MDKKVIKKTRKKEKVEFQDIRNSIKKMIRSIDSNWYDLSKELYDIYEGSMFTYWEYATFKDYVEQELNIEYRIAAYRVKIGGAIKEYGIEKKTVVDLGWTKFKEIIPFFTDDDTKNQKLIEMAKELTVRELQVKLKRNKGGENNAKIKLTFSFNQEQAGVLEEALKLGEIMLKTKDKNRILEAIISDWVMNNQ